MVGSGHESGSRPARCETQAASSGEVPGIRAVQDQDRKYSAGRMLSFHLSALTPSLIFNLCATCRLCSEVIVPNITFLTCLPISVAEENTVAHSSDLWHHPADVLPNCEVLRASCLLPKVLKWKVFCPRCDSCLWSECIKRDK